MNPSFLRKSSIRADTWAPERVAYGGPPAFLAHMAAIHNGLPAPIFATTSRTTVELLKYAENAMDAVLLSFWNEMLGYARTVGLSADQFLDLLDHIGDRSKFASVVRAPGRAFGLWCLPKDLRALLHEAAARGLPTHVLAGAQATNEQIRDLFGEGTQGSTDLLDTRDGRVTLTDQGRGQVRPAFAAAAPRRG